MLTARFKDLTGLIDAYSRLSYTESSEINTSLSKMLDTLKCPKHVVTAMKKSYYKSPWRSASDTDERECAKEQAFVIEKLKKFEMFSTDFDQPINAIRYGTSVYLYFGNPESGLLLDNVDEFFEFTEPADYSNVTPSELRSMLGANGDGSGVQLMPVDTQNMLTQSDLRQTLDSQKADLDGLKQKMEDVKDAKSGELAVLKAEIDKKMAELEKKKSDMMAVLNAKKAEMEEMIENMNNQIFLLDSQIYSICCYAGEVVKFGQIRKGRPASNKEPVVLHQKLRFLDEDLGRLASIYEIEWGDVGMFEEFLKHSPAAIETFAPNERCITLVRLSRTGTQIGMSSRFPYSNLMQEYEYYHGKTVGIIIRNGENIYLGWTDEDRVKISDDLILSQPINVGPVDVPEFRNEYEETQFYAKQKAERKVLVTGLVSRIFIYSILQGIVDRTNILPLPEGAKLSQQSEYVLYAVADRWLADTRFGSFGDIIDKCNSIISQGDKILTIQHLMPERERFTGWDKRWQNNRGRGDANRTHDCNIEDCHIYDVNLVELDEPVAMIYYHINDRVGIPASENKTVYTTKAADRDRLSNSTVIGEYIRQDRHIFVSVAKQWSMSDARSNFEVYEREFINLTYMNSVWLYWAINNKNLGGWSVGGTAVTYAYAIKYLNTMLDFVKKREANERNIISSIDARLCDDVYEWQLKLSEWKLANKVREITLYQAKRFVKHIRNNKTKDAVRG